MWSADRLVVTSVDTNKKGPGLAELTVCVLPPVAESFNKETSKATLQG